MSKKIISISLLFVLVWPIHALDQGTSSGIPGKDLSKFGIIGNPEQDIVVIPGYESRYNYTHNGVGRGTPDTLAYDYAWGAYFYGTPGDVFMTTFQAPADMTIKGVSVPVYRWGTGEQLTVSIHKVSYPYGSDGVMYDQGLVNGSGWLAGYDDGAGISLEGTAWNSAAGVCGGGAMIGNAQDPLGTVAAASGPPGTPTMGLAWPDGFTAATLDPTNNPGIENGGGDNWMALSDYGSEVDLLAGETVGVAVRYTGTGGDGSDPGIGFLYAAHTGVPWASMKYYASTAEGGADCGGTGGETGWYIRGWCFNFQLAADLTGDRGPVISGIDAPVTTLSTDAQTVSCVVTDDNPSGGDAGVAAVTLSYQLDSLTAAVQTVSMTDGGDGSWSGEIPGQAAGTFIYWSLTATDVGGLSTSSNPYSYFIFTATAGNDLIFNNQGMLYGNLLYSSYLYFYWGGTGFDLWDATYGGMTDELTAAYSTIVELAGTGPVYNNDAEVDAWFGGGKTYIVSSDEWLGARSGWVNTTYAPGSVAYDVLGIAADYNDINYAASGDQAGVSRLMAGADGFASDLAAFLADSLSLNYDPAYETGGSNWLDGVDPATGYTVDMTGYSLVLDSTGAVPADAAEYNVMIHGQAGNGGKSAFLSFDVLALNTVPSYYWVGAGDYCCYQPTLSPLVQAYEGLAAIAGIEDDVVVPKAFSLKGNYPNPFNPSTNIAFTLDVRSDVTVTVYSLLGEEVATLHNGIMQPGLQSVKWNGNDSHGAQVASGVYIYRVEAQDRALTGKMMLLK
ncbi:MAG: FlgD immunoglobulin-like domain containing protein [Candidatus Marinimicrobia bacterium]|nr:FlgD immunoglobulin-like domain containing protein [Candidatus Neomarinimicrobiota bacterium]